MLLFHWTFDDPGMDQNFQCGRLRHRSERCRLLPKLKRVPFPFRLGHLRYSFALEALAKGYVLLRQVGLVRPISAPNPSINHEIDGC